jgi:AraC-like DNA-binding protein
MLITSAHFLLLIISLLSIAASFWFKPRRIEHYFFAILALSLLLLASSNLLPTNFFVEQQVIALGAFATCNVFWLLTRCLFRKGKALSTAHYILAGIIALLILLSRTIDIFLTLQWIQHETVIWIKRSLTELLRLLSPSVLLLAFWEIIRSYSSSSKSVQTQKLWMAITMLVAVLSTRVIVPSIPLAPETSHLVFVIVRSIMASAVLLSILFVIWLQYQNRIASAINLIANVGEVDEGDALLASIQSLMEDAKQYLKADLKMMDIANTLGVPEYKISKVLKEKTDFDNFNHYINHFRLKHAKHLLADEHSKSWTILVISMESGFSSLATFNRVFKKLENCTPNDYRKGKRLRQG